MNRRSRIRQREANGKRDMASLRARCVVLSATIVISDICCSPTTLMPGIVSVCHDTSTASREDRQSTGHALPHGLIRMTQPIPFPINVIANPGNASVNEMINETSHGIFVTRFHYTNPVAPTKAVLTGLTRDGTFLIENGELTKPIKNMRYTDSMLSALKHISMIGRELEAIQLGTVTVPAMKLEKLRFTGATEY